jgi:hypothetical protein
VSGRERKREEFIKKELQKIGISIIGDKKARGRKNN